MGHLSINLAAFVLLRFFAWGVVKRDQASLFVGYFRAALVEGRWETLQFTTKITTWKEADKLEAFCPRPFSSHAQAGRQRTLFLRRRDQDLRVPQDGPRLREPRPRPHLCARERGALCAANAEWQRRAQARRQGALQKGLLCSCCFFLRRGGGCFR